MGLAVAVIVLIIFYVASIGDGMEKTRRTLQDMDSTEKQGMPVYYDYRKRSLIDRETKLMVIQYSDYDDNGELFYYWLTRPGVFGSQRFVRAQYFKVQLRHIPVKRPSNSNGEFLRSIGWN